MRHLFSLSKVDQAEQELLLNEFATPADLP